MYKEQLERIYDICEICKSKVNFEITKQNGILKQYLLKLGKFKLYFDSNKYKENYDQNKKLDESFSNEFKPSTHFCAVNLFRSTSHFLIYFLILVLASLSLITDLNHSEPTFLVFNNNNFTCMLYNNSQLLIQKLSDFIYYKYNFMQENFNSTKFESKNDFINYLNTKLPFNIIIIYILSCFLILTSSKRNDSTKREIKYSFLIWTSSFLLILTNFREFSKYFNEKTNEKFQDFKIKQETLFILLPLIQLTIFLKLFEQLFTISNKDEKIKIQKQTSKPNFIQTNRLDLVNNNLNYNPFQTSDSNFTSSNKHPAIEYYNSTAGSFFQNKSIHNKANKSIFSINSLSNTTKSIIKPAKFKPTLSSIYSTSHTAKLPNIKYSINNNSIIKNNSDNDDDDESSIISGITNLYLNKTKSPKFNDKSLFNPANSRITNDEYSFYQTDTQNNSYSRYCNNRSKIRLDSSFSNISINNETFNHSRTLFNSLVEKCSIITSRILVCLNAFIISFFLFKWYLSEIYLI